jgi:VanZ family protein
MVSMALLSRQKLVLILLAVYWLALFVLAHIPIPLFVRQAGVSDKTLHFLAYLILVFLLWVTVSRDKKVDWRRAIVWWVLLSVLGYGAVDELLQGCVGRSCDVRDFAADLAGVLAGLILLSFFTFWPAVFIVAGATIFGLTNISRVNLSTFLPVASAMFHLFSYAIFTMLWLQIVHLYCAVSPPKVRWVIVGLVVPIGFLSAVKLFSAIVGRSLGLRDVILAAVGIVVVVSTFYLTTLFRQLSGNSRAIGK